MTYALYKADMEWPKPLPFLTIYIVGLVFEDHMNN